MSTINPSLSAVRVDGFWRSLTGRALLIVSFSLAVGVASRYAVPLWFTPVPLTLQPLPVLLVGLALPAEDAFLCLALYLLEGAAGLPVFSPAGPGGVAQILGPTGGFLMSYPLVAALTSLIVRRVLPNLNRFAAATIAGVAASVLLLACGALWLMQLSHLSVAATFTAAVYPFLPGDALKILAAAGTYGTVQRLRRV